MNPEEGVYGENIENGGLEDERGIREETVEAHPQPTGEASFDSDGADAAADVRARGAEAVEGSEGTPEQDMEAVREGAAQDTGSGGMGREETPRNPDTSQGQFTQPSQEARSGPG